MKKPFVLFAILIGLTFFSCSSSDDVPQNPGQQLVKIEQKIYYEGDLEERIVIDYANLKPQLWTFYDENNNELGSTEFVYNSQGILVEVNDYTPNGAQTRELLITYDSQNRIIKTDQVYFSQPNDHIIVNFTHNLNNTINSVYSFLGNTEEKLFEVNANGIIDKEIVDGTTIVSVEYDNLNPITKTSYSTVSTYSYLDNGTMPFAYQSIFGNKPINVVLFQNSLDDASDSLITRLTSVINSPSSNQEFVYTLNAEGYPLTRTNYNNGELGDEFTFYYE